MMNQRQLLKIYNILLKHFGHRGWWPGETPFEIIVGAILTQNTAWKNVERAIENLKKDKSLTISKIHNIPLDELATLIRPSGYYNQKSLKLKAFTAFVFEEYKGRLSKMFQEDRDILREKLLSIKGIGKETADSILLYAGALPIFVVDLYTSRVLTRHQWIPEKADYQEMQYYFQDRLPVDVDLYKDFHAQIVAVGNTFCRKTPKCEDCPLKPLLPEK